MGAKEEALANLCAIVVKECPNVAESLIKPMIRKSIQLFGHIQLLSAKGNNIMVGTRLE